MKLIHQNIIPELRPLGRLIVRDPGVVPNKSSVYNQLLLTNFSLQDPDQVGKDLGCDIVACVEDHNVDYLSDAPDLLNFQASNESYVKVVIRRGYLLEMETWKRYPYKDVVFKSLFLGATGSWFKP